MSEDVGFEFRQCRPRGSLKFAADELLKDLMREMLPGSRAQAVVVDNGSRITISVVVIADKVIFSSDLTIEKSKTAGRERHWQLDPISKVLDDVRRQARTWRDKHRSGGLTA